MFDDSKYTTVPAEIKVRSAFFPKTARRESENAKEAAGYNEGEPCCLKEGAKLEA